jgi:hypothetical protein
LIVEAVKRKSVTELLDSWVALGKEDAMPAIDDLPLEPVDL